MYTSCIMDLKDHSQLHKVCSSLNPAVSWLCYLRSFSFFQASFFSSDISYFFKMC